MQISSPEPVTKLHGVEVDYLGYYQLHTFDMRHFEKVSRYLFTRKRFLRKPVVMLLNSSDLKRYCYNPSPIHCHTGYSAPKDLKLSWKQFDELATICLAHENLLS